MKGSWFRCSLHDRLSALNIIEWDLPEKCANAVNKVHACNLNDPPLCKCVARKKNPIRHP